DDGVDLLVRTIIDADAFATGMKQNLRAVIAIGAGIGEYVDLQRGELAGLVGAGLHRHAHRMPCRGRDELLLACEFELDRSSGLQRGHHQDVLDEHLLLAAETTADALAEHADLLGRKIEDLAQRTPRKEWRLRRDADIEHAARISPGEPAMGFERR